MATNYDFAGQADREAAAARAQVKPGCSLPAYYYTSPDRHRQDMAIMRERSWLLAGHVSQIPNPGDFFLFEFADESIVVVRSRTGVNAFYNVCRHRGSRLCLEAEGYAARLVCPYHAWSYDLNGALLGGVDMPDWFDKREYSLKQCHIGVADGVIFINLAAGDPPDFAAFIARMMPFMAPFQLDRCKLVVRDHVVCEANWKLVLENFCECYHCGVSHKEYTRTHRLDSMMGDFEDQGGDEQWVDVAKQEGAFVEPVFEGPETASFQFASHVQIGNGALSGGRDGRPLAPRLGTLTGWSGNWTGIGFNSMSQITCYDDHAILFSFIPKGPTSTYCTVQWLVHEDAVEGRDYDPQEIAYMWRHTFNEDKILCENNQRGVASAAYEPGPYAKSEVRSLETIQWYLNHFIDKAGA